MAQSPLLPKAQAALVDQTGRPTTEWYRFLSALRGLIGGDSELPAQLDALEKKVEALGSGTTYTGPASVKIVKSVITLLNDSAQPDPSSYYGTNAAGLRGYFLRELATLTDVDFTAEPADGDALVFNGTRWAPGAVSGGSGVPYYVADATSYSVPEYTQALFSMPIIADGTLAVDGYLIEVD